MNKPVYKSILMLLLTGFCLPLFAHVELDNPKGGETFAGGSTVTIQWHITITHVTLNWDLLFSSDGGMTWEAIQMDIPPGELSYQWQVPYLNTSLARISIIQDNQGQDYQDESTNFTIETTTTSNPVFPDFEIEIYPNPVRETLTVDLSKNSSWPAQLTLEDAVGRPLWYVRDEEQRVYIPMRSFASGVYFLQIKTAQGSFTRKIVVEKI